MNLLYKKFSRLPATIEDGVLRHPMAPLLMSYQEEYLMMKSAEVVCRNGGNILNVGYGLGIIDSFIKTYPITSHHIIELHPQLYQNAADAGYTNVHLGDWRDILPTFISQGLKFDGIYFDTHNIGPVDEWHDFSQQVDSVLAPGGIFSYFNITDRHRAESYIASELNYTRYLDILPLQDMENHLDRPWDKSLLAYRDYKLVYYIK